MIESELLSIKIFLTNLKAPKFKVNDRVRITKYENIFINVYPQMWSREIIIINSVLKTNLWTYKIKDLNGEKIVESFMKKSCCRVYF